MDDAVRAFYGVIDSTVYKRKWEATKAEGLNKTIFTLGGKNYNQQDFAQYIEKHQSINTKETIESFVEKTYDKWVDDLVIDFEDARLEQQYPEFRALVKEYRDGILLFELTDQMVWTKAIKDTTGLKKFYESNKGKYMWDNRIKATMVSSSVPEDAEKARDLIESGMDPDQLTSVMVNQETLDVKLKNKKFAKGENQFVDKVTWKPGITSVVYNDKGDAAFFIIEELVGAEPKSLSEARGLITADYQNYLEKEWIKELHSKYTVKVHEDVLSELK
jgi:peptidyl-prolyl cis-trans isomerase SurA